MRRSLLLFSVLVGLSSCVQHPLVESQAEKRWSEWLPGFTWVVEGPDERREIAQLVGAGPGASVYERRVDLNEDGKEDSIVTIGRGEGSGARAWRTVLTTYVFLGSERGSFGGAFRNARLWFKLTTLDSLATVKYGDTVTRRVFRLRREDEKWVIGVTEYVYEAGPGDGASRCLALKSVNTSESLLSAFIERSNEHS